MSAERNVPEPGELVYRPRSSWVPALFAFALALTLCGVFIAFMLPGWIYAIIGGVVALLAFRNIVRGGIRDYFHLPRKQRVRGAVLPVETISPPRS
jgi:energy-coupling factor transporter transmembrane protein EcfT